MADRFSQHNTWSSVVRAPTSISDVRRSNEALVLALLRSAPGLSNASIARKSGLAPQTVSVIVGDMSRRGLIKAGPVIRGKRGQPATPKYLNAEAAYSVGVELSWRHADAVLIDFEGGVLARWSRSYAYPDPDKLLGQIGEAVNDLVSSLDRGMQSRVAGMGVAMPAGVWSHLYRSLEDKKIGLAWRDLDAPDTLAEMTSLPTLVLNDGAAACQAELSYGSGRALNDFVHLFVGTFIGAGIVSQGRIFEGPTGNAANLGAMMGRSNGGNARPVHNIAGLEALDGKRAARGEPALSGSTAAEEWQGEAFEEWLEESGAALAFVIANSRAVLEYGAAIIDGNFPQPVRAKLVESIRNHLEALPALHVAWPDVEAGGVGAVAPAIGAATTPLNHIFFGHGTLLLK